MELRTKVKIWPEREGVLRHAQGERILLLGSCFSDEIGARLGMDLYPVTANPLGTVYNPLSILQLLEWGDVPECPERDGRWYDWRVHGSISGGTRRELMEKVAEGRARLQEALEQPGAAFVTYGTAWVFRLKEWENIVGNCHKYPSGMFERRRMTVEEVADATRRIVRLMPRKRVIFTVSPIRHIADGLHGNNLSKATLLLGIEQGCGEYFPAYEALVDDLRDYRFYGEDMAHPTSLASDYVYELLCSRYVSLAEERISAQCRKFALMSRHRPSRPAEHHEQMLRAYERLTEAYPEVAEEARKLLV